MNDKVLQIVLKATNLTAGPLAEVSTQVKALAATAESTTAKMAAAGTAVSHVGSSLLPLSLAAGGILGASAKIAIDFEQKMELLNTQALTSQKVVEDLKVKVLALAPAVGIGPEKLADALYHIMSNGVPAAQAMDYLKVAAQGAAIGQSNLETTTQAMLGVMAVGFSDVHGAGDAMAYLNTTVGIGDMRMEKLAASIATGVLPSFKSAGLGMKDYSAALATLTDNVTPADEAATRLRMTVSLMAAPSGVAVKALNSIGLSSVSLANDMRSGGLMRAIDDLNSHLQSTYPAGQSFKLSAKEQQLEMKHFKESLDSAGIPLKNQQAALTGYATKLREVGSAAVFQEHAAEKAFGGGRTSGAILTLMEESDRLRSKYDSLGNSTTRAAQFQDAWAHQQDTAKQKMDSFKASVDVLGVKIGNDFLPALTGLAQGAGKIADSLSKLPPDQMKMLVDTLIGISIAGPGLMIAGTAMTMISKIGDFAGGTIEKLPGVIETMGRMGGTAGNGIKTAGQRLGDFAANALEAGKYGLYVVGEWTKTAGELVVQAGRVTLAWVKGAAETVVAWTVAGAQTLKQWVILAAESSVNAIKAAGAWIAAAHASEEGFLGTLLKMGVGYVNLASTATVNAIKASAVWIAETTKAGAIYVATSAMNGALLVAQVLKDTAIITAAWTFSAIQSVGAWVLNLPRMIASMVLTSSGAIMNAAKATVAWTVSAAESTAAWFIFQVKTIASFVATTAAAVVSGVRIAAVFAANAIQAGALATSVDIAKASIVAMQLTIATPAILAISIGAALAAIALVMSKVRETQDAIKGVEASQKVDQDVSLGLYRASLRVSDPAKRAKLQALANAPAEQLDGNSQFWAGFKIPGFNAKGTSNWSGGPTWVGEEGPELINLPSGTQIHSNPDSQKMMGGSSSVNLSVNVGMYGGEPGEIRNIASRIYQELQRIDKANGKALLPDIGVRP